MKEKYINKTCKRHGDDVKFRWSGERYRCIACETQYRIDGRKRNKERLVLEHGGSCLKCGYNSCLRALQFHHVDPQTKAFGIAKFQVSMSYNTLREESKKCILLCANCHAEYEDGLWTLFEGLINNKTAVFGDLAYSGLNYSLS